MLSQLCPFSLYQLHDTGRREHNCQASCSEIWRKRQVLQKLNQGVHRKEKVSPLLRKVLICSHFFKKEKKKTLYNPHNYSVTTELQTQCPKLHSLTPTKPYIQEVNVLC